MLARKLSGFAIVMILMMLSTNAINVKAAEPTPRGWTEHDYTLKFEQDTENKLTTNCFDGNQPYTFVEGSKAGDATFSYNWLTNQKTKISDTTLFSCNEYNGLLYGGPVNNNIINTLVFSSRQPLAKPSQYYPDSRMLGESGNAVLDATDGSFYAYNRAYDKPERSLFVSADGGLTWQERGSQFRGKLKDVVVSQADARAIYALVNDKPEAPFDDKAYAIYFSGDAGATWEKRSEISPAASGYSIYTMQGHTAPVATVILETLVTGTGKRFISNDGGRTFVQYTRYHGGSGPNPGIPDTKPAELFHTGDGLVRYGLNESENAIVFEYSSDQAKTWQARTLPFTPPTGKIGTLYQVPNLAASFVLDETGGSLWYTSDAGQNWKNIGISRPFQITPYLPVSLVSFGQGKVYTIELSTNPTNSAFDNKTLGNIYFPETKHNLWGVFKKYWEAGGGLAAYGYPKSEPFREVNPADGKIYTVQYFERNRFEYHPENTGSKFEVLLGLLGNQQTEQRRAANESSFKRIADPKIATFTYFPETGHTLANDFKKYWEVGGGLAQFGYPISEEFEEANPDNGKRYTVQYFERNRFEFHPENKGSPYLVLLGLLGNNLIREKGWQQ